MIKRITLDVELEALEGEGEIGDWDAEAMIKDKLLTLDLSDERRNTWVFRSVRLAG